MERAAAGVLLACCRTCFGCLGSENSLLFLAGNLYNNGGFSAASDHSLSLSRVGFRKIRSIFFPVSRESATRERVAADCFLRQLDDSRPSECPQHEYRECLSLEAGRAWRVPSCGGWAGALRHRPAGDLVCAAQA